MPLLRLRIPFKCVYKSLLLTFWSLFDLYISFSLDGLSFFVKWLKFVCCAEWIFGKWVNFVKLSIQLEVFEELVSCCSLTCTSLRHTGVHETHKFYTHIRGHCCEILSAFHHNCNYLPMQYQWRRSDLQRETSATWRFRPL